MPKLSEEMARAMMAKSGNSLPAEAGVKSPATESLQESLTNIKNNSPRIDSAQRDLAAAKSVAADKADDSLLDTAKGNIGRLAPSAIRALALVAGTGGVGALLGGAGLLSDTNSIRAQDQKASADAVSGIEGTLEGLKQQRADNIMDILIKQPGLLLDSEFNSIVNPLALGTMAGLGIPIDPGVLSNMEQNAALWTESMPSLLRTFPELDSAGRFSGLLMLKNQGLNLTFDQMFAMANDELGDSKSVKDLFGPYAMSAGIIKAGIMWPGEDPLVHLQDPAIISHMAATQVNKENAKVEKDGALSPSEQFKAMMLRLIDQRIEFEKSFSEQSGELESNAENLSRGAGLTDTESKVLASAYPTLGAGLNSAELSEMLAQTLDDIFVNEAQVRVTTQEGADILFRNREDVVEMLTEAYANRLVVGSDRRTVAALDEARKRVNDLIAPGGQFEGNKDGAVAFVKKEMRDKQAGNGQ